MSHVEVSGDTNYKAHMCDHGKTVARLLCTSTARNALSSHSIVQHTRRRATLQPVHDTPAITLFPKTLPMITVMPCPALKKAQTRTPSKAILLLFRRTHMQLYYGYLFQLLLTSLAVPSVGCGASSQTGRKVPGFIH